ncbi:MAG: HNH endonuclease [Hydrogenophaga sp.]|nr:HNH endonuclease [Hydrogenophaga sp.]
MVSPQTFFAALRAGEPIQGVWLNSRRYHVFCESGATCVECGLEGLYFARERSPGQKGKFHFNLYGIQNGTEVLFTRDHIQPLSKGGSNKLENQQTMCAFCNQRKGNKTPESSQVVKAPS